jgi:hypothetical protein
LGFQFISSVIGAAALSSTLLSGDWDRHHRARRAKVMQLLAIEPPGEDDGHRFH